MKVKQETVLEALKGVQDPDLKLDIVTLGFVKDVEISGGTVCLRLELTTPACPAREALTEEVRKRLSGIAGVEDVEIELDFKVTSRIGEQHRELIPHVRNIIAVASGKGGVGKSTIAVNLATALSSFGTRVGLMDADVYGPSIPKLMGAFDQPQLTPENRIIPPQVRDVKLISMGYFLPKNEAVIWRGPMLHKMVQDFLGLVEWGELDYLVVDLPPGTGDIQLSLCQTIPLTGAVVVSTPQDLALEVASKAIAMFKKLKTPILGIVENMSHYVCSHCGQRDDIFGHGGARQASERLGYPFLGEIPLSTLIRQRSDSGIPVALDGDPDNARPFLDLACAVAAQVSIANFSEEQSLLIED